MAAGDGATCRLEWPTPTVEVESDVQLPVKQLCRLLAASKLRALLMTRSRAAIRHACSPLTCLLAIYEFQMISKRRSKSLDLSVVLDAKQHTIHAT
jgi:hypothetical protein